jgi:hypothetical protein
MCGASKVAEHHDDAVSGTTLAIGQIGTHGGGSLGAFHRPGQDPKACILYVQSGTMLTIGNISPRLQRKFDLEVTALAQFVETPEWHDDDRLVFENGKDVPLIAFADKGITAFVGVKEVADTDPVNLVEPGGPAFVAHTGVLETHGAGRAVA